MSTLINVIAFLAAWLGFGLLIAPFIGGMLKDRMDRQCPVRRKSL